MYKKKKGEKKEKKITNVLKRTLNFYNEKKYFCLPFKGAVSVLHTNVTDSPSLTVADCGNVAKTGLFGSSFGTIDKIAK